MDSQRFIAGFIKIVEKYPVLYDPKMPERTIPLCNVTWEKVAEQVRNELHENFTVDELKTKWKGLRSSFSRFKRKLECCPNDNSKQYYLFDALKFLLPYTKNRRRTANLVRNDDQSSSESDLELPQHLSNEDGVDHTNSSTSDSLVTPYTTDSQLAYPPVKIEPSDEYHSDTDIPREYNDKNRSSKRKSHSYDDEPTTSKVQKNEDENTDMQFFKSILPDIEHFTKQEKRRFKMGVLKLIDDVESSRRDVRCRVSGVTSLTNSNF